jgi:gliding motility-associated-like protein
MLFRFILFVSFLQIPYSYAQTLVFAELTGSPNIVTTGWNFSGAANSGDSGGDIDNFSNEIVLTDAINSSSGGIFFNESIDLSTCLQWKVEFDFRMWEGSAADGIAFCFLDVPPTGFVSGGGVGIPATSNGVFVILDTYDNGCGINPEIQLFQGTNYDECSPGVINRAENLSFLRSTNYQTCLVEYNSGTITVSVNGVIYLTGSYSANIIGYMGFTASTGGATDKHSIRNVRIYADIAEADAGQDVTICSGGTAQLGSANNPTYSYLWSGNTNLSSYSISNPTVTLTNNTVTPITQTFSLETILSSSPNSCPDNDDVIVTILPNTSSTVDANICTGASYTIGGQSFSTAGTHQAVVNGVNGCDSTVTLNLSLIPNIQTNLTESICQGSSYTFGNQTLTNAGDYYQTLQTSAGCDSIVNLSLTINPILSSSQFETICDGESVTFYGQTLTVAGLFNHTLQTTNGCDSIITLNLIVNPIPSPPSIVSNSPLECPGDALIMIAEPIVGATYSWSGPGNFTSSDNEIFLIIDNQNTGTYSVYIYLNGCQSPPSLEQISIANTGVSDNFDVPNVITPNNDGVNEEIEFNTLFSSCIPFHFELFNRWGNLVFEQENGGEAFKGTTIGGKKLEDGIYFYKLNYGEQKKTGFIHILW